MTSCLFPVDWIVLAVAAIVSVFSVVARYLSQRVYALVKPIPLFLIIALYFVRLVSMPAGVSLFAVAILAGLVAGVLGDILLLFPKRFLVGLVAFLLGHIMYIAAFLVSGPFTLPLPWTMIPFAVTIPYGILVLIRMEAARRKKYAVPVVIYLVAITAMFVAALNLDRHAGSGPHLFTIAAALFCVSDGVLAWNRFCKPFRAAEGIILPTYYAAQILIALGAICIV